MLIAGCAQSTAPRPTTPSPAAPPGVTTATQGCLSAQPEGASIAWSRMRNPILSYANSGIRDIGVRLLHGQWHLYFTSVVGGGPDWRVATTASNDLVAWEGPTIWPPQAGTLGVASPDVTQRPDFTYIVTYQSDPGETAPPGVPPGPRGEDKLYYRKSVDLVDWSQPQRLMPAIHPAPAERLIDAALAWTDHGLFLGYKFGTTDTSQHFEIAWSASGAIEGPWTYVGRPNITVNGDTIENYQFLRIDGVWNLLATSNSLDQPWLFTLDGDPAQSASWLKWSAGRHLDIPTGSWDSAPGIPSVTYEPANSAYLCDARAVDGHFYLFYVGANELGTYGGWGHTKLGVARSTDLTRWEVPPGR